MKPTKENQLTPLEYASQPVPAPPRYLGRRVLVFASGTHLVLCAVFSMPGPVFGYAWPHPVILAAEIPLVVCLVTTPLFFLVELGMLILHPKRFPVWIPVGRVLWVTAAFLYGMAHWGP